MAKKKLEEGGAEQSSSAREFEKTDRVLIEGLEGGALKVGKQYKIIGATAKLLINKGSAKFIEIL